MFLASKKFLKKVVLKDHFHPYDGLLELFLVYKDEFYENNLKHKSSR